ncbi:MAG TPA: allantoate amidohydrolase [Candidatus Dormibacteraeota bacterium]|nr:allantoate amidohydrolase [Candidatus Dormibacteraeota bacterium]
MSLARTVMERCQELAECSEEEGMITRPIASEAMRRAQALVTGWMEAAGMAVTPDNIGNLRARYPGDGDAVMLLGSHIDSARDAGKYDGPLGVLTAIAAVQHLRDQGRRLPFAIEVLAFADEEGLRFPTTYLGSKVVAGMFNPRDLELTDARGVSLRSAIESFGGNPDRIAEDRWRGSRPIGYCEVHIEQGPVLEQRGAALGVVRGIAGQNRYLLTFRGEAGHAGTVPMNRRRDALVAASEFVVAVEREARAHDGLVATVGRIEVRPGAPNVIPREVELTLDVRHAEDARRAGVAERILEHANQIANQRGMDLAVELVSENVAVPCSPKIVSQLAKAVGDPVIMVTSGAGHDAVTMSTITEVGMLFVRCKGGISHSPLESVEEEDVQAAIDVLNRFLELAAQA